MRPFRCLPLLLLACLPLLHAAPLTGEQAAAHVLNRLAFGPRPGDIQRVAEMGVQRYVDEQLQPASIPLPEELSRRLHALQTLQEPAGATLGRFLEVRAMRRDEDEAFKAKRREVFGQIANEAAEARLLRAVESPRQLEEVLVDFWFNHFNVFSGKGEVRALATSFERDAIRPYVLGSFRDLLGATAKHPAMLFYLDNWISKANGLNENYARELMELHTMGVDQGYTQKDVTELARMLTGWTYRPRKLVGDNETFFFDPKRHDKESKQWLGWTIHAKGQTEGEHALDVLALHPATARHISHKLAQYFVADVPPPALVDRMARTWLESRGDIRTVLRTLFSSAEFMDSSVAGAKFKTPYQYVVSAARASGTGMTDAKRMQGVLARLGMPLYGCQTPDGYKNTQDAWLNPDALAMRIGLAASLGQNASVETVQAALGPSIALRTQEVAAASPERLRSALLLGSPDFMQR
ncbi:DUF1800 domain-containing protein [Massilia endophytica]|uniref:DUF1800 domain-containing protein n=1 Tax=Massilia endophytica TaxID=2899220 RepID=UPI001E5F9E53|nr:DUF1800 domain-containing protein [Massilia endophytica]UGQ45422.1 DUF1800 domain-containing protein [Massilia endophytica]